jgi:hypothetical protein
MALRRAMDAGRSAAVRLLNYARDGTPLWNQLSVLPLRCAARPAPCPLPACVGACYKLQSVPRGGCLYQAERLKVSHGLWQCLLYL